MRSLPARSPLPRRRFSRAEWVLHPGLRYYAELESESGRLLIELLRESAPRTVNAFVFLALHRFYDGLAWHRVVPGFVVQTGDPTGDGGGHAGFFVPLELDPALTYDDAGWVGLARRAGDLRGSSQFFITLAPAPRLDCRYTLFGRLLRGREVLPSIVQGERLQTVRILVEENG